MRAPIALFAIALIIRVAVAVHWQFDGLYGQDAFAYYDQAAALGERLPRGELPPADFFWPNGYPVLAALAMWVLGRTPPAAQAVGVLCGAALAPLAYALCRALFPEARPRAAIVSGLIVSMAGQPILSSVSIMADVPALFWATLAAWLIARARRTTRPAVWLLPAGASLAMAIVTRWIYALLIPVFAAYALGQARHRRSWKWLLLPALSGALILAPQIALSLNRPEGLLHSWLVGWNPANAVRSVFDNVDGHFEYDLPVGLFYAEPGGHPAYLFPLLGVAAVWGLWRAWRTRNRDALTLLLGWPAVVYAFLAGIPYENFRFGLSLYMPLVVMAGFGLSEVRDRFTPRWIVPSIAVVSLAGMLAWAYPMLDRFLTAQNASKAIALKVGDSLPPNATLISFGLTLTLRHYTRLNVIELFYQDAGSLDSLTREQPTVYLLLDTANVAGQWQGREPEVNFRWLGEHTTLTPTSVFPPYTLFRAERSTPSP